MKFSPNNCDESTYMLSESVGEPDEDNVTKETSRSTPKKKVQSILLVGDSLATTTCKICQMSYKAHLPQDKELHTKHHQWYVNGIPWSQALISKLLGTFKMPMKQGTAVFVNVVQVNKDLAREIVGCRKILRMVNQELSSPVDSELWANKSSDQSKAIVLVINSRAIGMVLTDELSEGQSQWMVYRTGDVVPNQKNTKAKIGISRIWISGKWRRRGLAEKLLGFVIKFSTYGAKLRPDEVAFSQPSSAGTQLAKKFNGVVHKSGEILIPVYVEKMSNDE